MPPKKKSKEAAASARPPARKAPLPWSQRLLAFLDARANLLALLLILTGTGRIVSTYTVFNHTVDEPAHIGCGMEWLDKGTYHLEDQHPPLSRIFVALGPWLDGGHSHDRPTIYNEGAAILYADQGKHYDRTLSLARAGILPFFWIACGVLFLAVRHWVGRIEAVAALFFFSMTPVVLGHAGLATTDMALTAMFGAAAAAMLWWLEEPRWARALLFGLATGLMAVSKFSGLVFLPICSASGVVLFWWTQRPGWRTVARETWHRLPGFLLAVLTGAFVIWACYRFSFGHAPQFSFQVPAPEFFTGLASAEAHQKAGHPSYLLGRISKSGWWPFYFVVVGVKTPLALLLPALVGVVLAVRRWRQGLWCFLLAFIVGIVAVGLYSRINIGVRHVLPIYFALALVATLVIIEGLRQTTAKWKAWLGAVCLLWCLTGSVSAHPDYMADFNMLAGSEPERIVVDSDLDWGQDMKRLGARLRELGAREVAFSPFVSAYLEAVHGFPPLHDNDPVTPSPGWNAVSLTSLKLARLGLFDQYPNITLWPNVATPRERVGKGVLLFYFPPVNAPPTR
jgi:hypothetical protein